MPNTYELLEFLVIEKLVKTPGNYYDSTNGIRLSLSADGESIWYCVTDPEKMTESGATYALAEFLTQ